MTTIYIDFETYYDKDYSLSKMSTEEYIRDGRFKVHGACVAVDGYPVEWHSDEDHMRDTLRTYHETYPDSAWCAHNAAFDMAILSWRFGIHPKTIIDTLSMARLADVHGRHSLDALAKKYALGAKGDALIKTLGVRDLDPMLETQLGEYCKQDVELLRKLHHHLQTQLEREIGALRLKREMALIDLTVKMFTEPVLEVDAALLQARLEELEAQRNAAVKASGVHLDVLMSNQQFASVLAAHGVQVPETLRKMDPDLLALKDDPRVGHLVRGRLAAKSVSELRRTSKFLGVSGRGTMPVPLKYYGAHTGRWSGSDGLNMQNLNRGSALRKCLQAPDGHVLVVVDSSQIEARVLAWLAGQQDLLEQFAAGDDVYVRFASRIWPDTQIDELKRFVGKTCLAANTKVLTDHGWKPIISVTATDLVWDGESWVKHSGVIFQGRKPTLRGIGVNATSGHEILTGHGWVEWSEVLKNRSLLASALFTATLPSLTGVRWFAHQAGKWLGGTRMSDALAGTKGWLTGTISYLGGLLAATRARKSLPAKNGTGSTLMRSPMPLTAPGYLTACRHALGGATTHGTQAFRVTAAEEFMSAKNGEMTDQRFFDTYKPFQGGMFQSLNLTGSTWTALTPQGMSGLSPEKKTSQTVEKPTTYPNESSRLSENLPVYDLLNCGPNSRFTVMTDLGPVIVHNCILGLGYGVGHVKLHAQIVVKQPETTLDDAAQYVATYRNTYAAIRRLWKQADGMLRAMMQDGRVEWTRGIATEFERLTLPSGRVLRYPDLRLSAEGFEYGAAKRIYAPALIENIVQSIARDIVADQMLAIGRRYRIVTMTHDEVVFLVAEEEAAEAFEFATEVMRAAPGYAAGVPLNCAGGYAKEYSK